MRIAFLTAAAALSVAAAPAAKNWTATVVMTPEGGFRMGNPAAPVKVVEYGSLTCGHCANFAQESAKPLAAHVRSGKVSFEYRNLVLNGLDVAASLLARCGGPAKFFPLAEQIYAAQPQWLGKMGTVSQAERDQVNALPEKQRLARVAELTGLAQIAARNGIANAKAKQCIADEAALGRLEALAKGAAAQGVNGTPTFFINGRRADGNSWPAIDTAIRTAAGRR